jgi:hypothetical protein
MGQAIPSQHPAVVLRSHFRQVRALLAVAMIAVVGLTAAVVILATDNDRDTSAGVPAVPAARAASQTGPYSAGRAASGVSRGSATHVSSPNPAGSTRYDGGPEEGTRGVVPARQRDVRYDGGPEEGTRGARSSDSASNAVSATRYDGGPEEGTRFGGH